MLNPKLLLILTFTITTVILGYANFPNNWSNEKIPVSADKVIVQKSTRQLSLLKGGEVIKTYRISLGFSPVGNKEIEGDGKTPEGKYEIDAKNPNSVAHLSLHISYPTIEQIAAAHSKNQTPGGMIMIHGIMNGLGWTGRFHRYFDWTNGCIAVTNQEMGEIYNAVSIGTPIEILP